MMTDRERSRQTRSARPAKTGTSQTIPTTAAGSLALAGSGRLVS